MRRGIWTMVAVALVVAACSGSTEPTTTVAQTPATEADIADEQSGTTDIDGELFAINMFKVGDCINVPYGDPIVAHAPLSCNEPHTVEVYAVLEHPAPAGTPDLGNEPLITWADNACLDNFEAYVGIASVESRMYHWSLPPNVDEWEAGERTLVCLLYEFAEDGDIAVTTSTAKDSQR